MTEYGRTSEWQSKQFHFHQPSEHTINGENLDAEMHMVFKGTTYPDELAVVGLLFKADDDETPNPFLESLMLFELEPKRFTEIDEIMVNPEELYFDLPDTSKYTYIGSLTTPPCSESVTWFVYKEPARISQDQLEQLHRLLSKEKKETDGNNRNVEPLGSRNLFLVEDSTDIFE